MSTKVLKVFESAEYNEFDLFEGDEKLGYYYEHFVHPETGKKFDSPVFEIYYDNTSDDPEDPDYTTSIIIEDEEEALDFIQNSIY